MAYAVHYPQRERSRSRGRSIGSVSSRESSVSSTRRHNMEGNFPPIQRWNGQTREATDWNSLRRDPEIWHPQGNCLVYLFERGASRRGPSFRIPYDFLLYSSCRPLIDHSMTAGLQTSLYHPGSTTPPSYDNLTDTLSHESSYCSLHLEAPAEMSRIERFNYHITTRNFFAWLVGAPLVGPDPVSALLDLKVRMDIWRDPGADNFGSLFQYVQEQSYGDFEDLEIQMGKRLDGEVFHAPQPYRNISHTLEQQDLEEKRGRRTSIANLGQAFRSGGRTLKKKLSRTFSRSRGPSETRQSQSPVETTAAFPTLRQDVHKIMQPQIRTQSPQRHIIPAPAVPATEKEVPKPKKRESSLTRFAKRRLSWAAGPLRSDGEPVETDAGMVEPVLSGPTSTPGLPAGPVVGPSELTALPPVTQVPALSSRSQLSLQTRDLDSSAVAPNVPMRSPRRSSSANANISRVDSTNNVGFTLRSTSRTSLHDLSICACCGKPRKPNINGVDPAKIPLHAEQLKRTSHGSLYAEINVPNWGNGTAEGGSGSGSSSSPCQLRRSYAPPRHRARHSSTHSFVSRASSVAPSPPGLDYGHGSTSASDSGPASPVSRDGSPRGCRTNMDQMIWQLGHGNGSGSGSSNEGGDESDVKKGKKRASADSETLGAVYHQKATMTTSPMQYEPSTGADMIGRARGTGYTSGLERSGVVCELPA